MKVALCLAVLGLAVLASAGQIKYDNYKVYRFTPQTEEERALLLSLEENNPGVVFWKHVRSVGLPVDIMFPPHLQGDLVDALKGQGVMNYEMVSDVQSLIDEEAAGSLGASPKLSWTAYHSTAEIYEYLDEVAAEFPALATTGVYGQSFNGQDLRHIILNKGNTKKPIIFIDANIHAREWITNAVATYTIEALVRGDDPAVKALLDDFNFVFAPVLNPDGYEYTRSTERLWRKTRSNFAAGLCRGADPNRNFGFGWNTGGSSSQPCSDTYMGVSAFSEPEAKAVSDLLSSIADDTVFYLSLHSYSQLILIPYGTDLGRVPDHAQHMTIGNLAATAIAKRYGTKYTPGNIVELLYVASGASVDYMKGTFDTDLAYTFEMRDTGTYGFVLPPAQIIPSSLEFLDGLLVIAEQLKLKQAKH